MCAPPERSEPATANQVDGSAMEPPPTDFDLAYRANYAGVHRFVFRLVGDNTLADDLTQDTFVKAYRAWDSFRVESSIRTWLYRIARNVCLDYLRSPEDASRPARPRRVQQRRTRQTTRVFAGRSENASPPRQAQAATDGRTTMRPVPRQTQRALLSPRLDRHNHAAIYWLRLGVVVVGAVQVHI